MNMTNMTIEQEIERLNDYLSYIQNRIGQLEFILKDCQDIEDKTSWTLNWDEGDTMYFFENMCWVNKRTFSYGNTDDINMKHCHRAFKSEKFADMFGYKTQHTADLLHFKWLYDREYEPDWNDTETPKYFIGYDMKDKKYKPVHTYDMYNRSSVYFSTQEIAQKAADWLNR